MIFSCCFKYVNIILTNWYVDALPFKTVKYFREFILLYKEVSGYFDGKL